MATVLALFKDSQAAGSAVADLKNEGFTKDISLVTKDFNESELDTTTHTIKQQSSDGVVGGAVIGAAIGGISSLLAGIAAITIPGAGILIAGPLAAALTAAGAGAAIGGVVGALVDLGVPDDQARMYAEHVEAGEVLVMITVSDGREGEVADMLSEKGAIDVVKTEV